MIDIRELQPATLVTLKTVCKEKNETLQYMLQFGTALEKAMATMILAAGGEKL